MADEEPRFGFGDNWRRYLDQADDEALLEANAALCDLLGLQDLSGKTFLDIGSGSGVHSLAAHDLGAVVTSFDYDADSVACTTELWRRRGEPPTWRVEQGSALDAEYLARLGTFDLVYSWGVLHHTGDMWAAIRGAADRVAADGVFVIGIYNRRRLLSQMMWALKRGYVGAGPIGKKALMYSYWAFTQSYQVARGRNPLTAMKDRRGRGMDYWRDIEDWVGGYPFESAKPAEVRDFVEPLGFTLVEQRTKTGFAHVNEYIFHRR